MSWAATLWAGISSSSSSSAAAPQCEGPLLGRHGLCVFSKRLERGRFAAPWRRSTDGVITMSRSELQLFREGRQLVFVGALSPAEIRARATGIVYHVGAFGAAFLPMGLTAIAASAGVSLAQVMMLSVALFQLILVGLLTLRPKELRRSSEGEPALATSSLAH